MENQEDIVKTEQTQTSFACDGEKLEATGAELYEMRSELSALRDLFSRRLMNDK